MQCTCRIADKTYSAIGSLKPR